MIDMNDILEIKNDKRINELVDKIKETNKLSQQLMNQTDKCIRNYNVAISYLITTPDIIPYEQMAVKNYLTGKDVEGTYSLNISKEGIFRKTSLRDSMDCFFIQFTQITEPTKEYAAFSLMYAITRERVYNPLKKILTPEGINIINKLVDKHNSIKPPVITKLNMYYKISNITDAEKKYFGIITNGARLYFKSFRENVIPFVSNQYYIKDVKFPTFSYRVFMEDGEENRKHPNEYLPEKMFILNHYDDIATAINSYHGFLKSKIQKHLDFFEYANSLVERYAVLGKL